MDERLSVDGAEGKCDFVPPYKTRCRVATCILIELGSTSDYSLHLFLICTHLVTETGTKMKFYPDTKTMGKKERKKGRSVVSTKNPGLCVDALDRFRTLLFLHHHE